MEDILDDIAEARYDADARFIFSEQGVKRLARKDTIRFVTTLLMSGLIMLLALKYYSGYYLSNDVFRTSGMLTGVLLVYALYRYNRTAKRLRTFEVYVGDRGILRKIKGLDDYFLPWTAVKQAKLMNTGNIHIETGTKGKNILLWHHLDRYEELIDRIAKYTNVAKGSDQGIGTIISSGLSFLYILSVGGLYLLTDMWAVVGMSVIVVLMTTYYTYIYITNAQLSFRYKLSVIPLILLSLISIYKALWVLGIVEDLPSFIP